MDAANELSHTIVRNAVFNFIVIAGANIKNRINLKKLGNCWQINDALIAKIDCKFLITDLQVAINLKNRLDFFIVEIIVKKKVTHLK